MVDFPPPRNRAFVSYSHADAEHLKRLHVHLAPYEREQKVDVWDDTRIKPGTNWKEEIKQAMARAKVAILLVSADFMASEFIAHDELPPLLEAAEQEGTLIVPVILSPCAFEWSKLARYQSLNAPSDPIIDMPRGKQEAVWKRLAKYVADALAPATKILLEEHREPTPPEPKGEVHRAITRRKLLLGLAGTVVVGSGIAAVTWYAHTPQTIISTGPTPTPTLTPKSTPTSIPTSSSVGTLLYTYRGHSAYVASVAWSPDGKRIASGSYDNTVQVWDAANGGHAFTYKGQTDGAYGVESVTWLPDGKRIASGSSDNTVQVWNTDGTSVYTYSGHSNTVWSVTWSPPEARRIASGSVDNTVQVWDSADGGNAFIYHGHAASTYGVFSVAWSPDGKRIASGGCDNTVQVWDAVNGSNAYIYHGHATAPLGVLSVAWSPDGKRIVSGGDDGTAQVWNPDGSNTYIYRGHTSRVKSVAWSPDGKRIASASDDGTVHLWNPDGSNVYIYRKHSNPVWTAAWSLDGKYIASGSSDNTVQVWWASGV